jgi:hypothetical protein
VNVCSRCVFFFFRFFRNRSEIGWNLQGLNSIACLMIFDAAIFSPTKTYGYLNLCVICDLPR